MSKLPVQTFLDALAQESVLQTARKIVLAAAKDGVTCPCCGQYVKSYKRALNAPMVQFLIWLVLAWQKDERWYDFREAPLIQSRRGGGDFPKLVLWGLIETAKAPMQGKRTSGLYRPTTKGVAFVHAHLSVPSHVLLYDNRVLGWSDKNVDVVQALGKHFDYQTLMQESNEEST